LTTVSQAPAATREAFGPTLARLTEEGLDIVVVDADLGSSTTARLFGKTHPDRFFTVGVAEQNMIGVAAGLAAAGKIAFASTFAVFMPGRCFDQIRVSVAQPRLNVKLVASHAGISVGEDGISAHAIEDLALMSSLPGFRVIVPADVVEAAQAVEAAARTDGPFYIRCGRPKVPVIYDESYRFRLGKAHLLRPGKDVTVIAMGIMAKAAVDAADLLERDGIDCRLLNMATLRPLDREAIVAAARETGAIVTAEEHLVHCGLGSMVAQVLAGAHPVPMGFVGVQDRYAESGRWDELLEKYGLTAEAIAQEARKLLVRRGTKP
jgi:transketolase